MQILLLPKPLFCLSRSKVTKRSKINIWGLKKMKAAVHENYGDQNAILVSSINNLVPKADELLIKVHATTVNRTDCAFLTGEPFIMRFFAGYNKPKNPITGTDFAGTVQDTGSAVARFKAGDRIAGLNTDGLSSHAEYIVISGKCAIAKIPDNLTFKVAVAALEGAHYAYNFIKRISDIEGKSVLVNGATGAIGSAGLQFLKYHGAEVTAVCHSDQDEIVKNMGADETIHFNQTDFTHCGKQFDVVFDAVGKSTFGKCKKVLKPKGLYISSELGPKAQNPFFALVSPILPGRTVKFPVPTDTPGSLEYILARLEDDSFKPLIDRTYAFDEIKNAFKYVMKGQKIGNVVLMMETD